MNKILINGTFDKQRVSRTFFKERLEIFCDVSPIDFRDLNNYSAVFFVGEFKKEELYKWIGTEHLRICKDDDELEEQLFFFLGYPQPLEIERKFLVEYPDIEYIKRLENTNFVNISQAYIQTKYSYYRVRKRGKNEENIYIRSVKKAITETTRIEVEDRMEQEDYENEIKGRKVLSKVRYLIVYKDKYFELDVFPFWPDKALLEIELTHEDEKFEIPPYIKVIKEVTNDKAYRNSNLYKIYGK